MERHLHAKQRHLWIFFEQKQSMDDDSPQALLLFPLREAVIHYICIRFSKYKCPDII